MTVLLADQNLAQGNIQAVTLKPLFLGYTVGMALDTLLFCILMACYDVNPQMVQLQGANSAAGYLDRAIHRRAITDAAGMTVYRGLNVDEMKYVEGLPYCFARINSFSRRKTVAEGLLRQGNRPVRVLLMAKVYYFMDMTLCSFHPNEDEVVVPMLVDFLCTKVVPNQTENYVEVHLVQLPGAPLLKASLDQRSVVKMCCDRTLSLAKQAHCLSLAPGDRAIPETEAEKQLAVGIEKIR